jgi:hypothetical protein
MTGTSSLPTPMIRSLPRQNQANRQERKSLPGMRKQNGQQILDYRPPAFTEHHRCDDGALCAPGDVMPSVTTHAVPRAIANAMAQITGQVNNRRVKTHGRWVSCGKRRRTVPRIAKPAGRQSRSRACFLLPYTVERTVRGVLSVERRYIPISISAPQGGNREPENPRHHENRSIRKAETGTSASRLSDRE